MNNTDEMLPRLCPECKTNNLKIYNGKYSKYCIPCSYKNKRKKTEKKVYIRICKKCKNQFSATNHFQSYCQNPCTSKKSFKDKWLDEKPKKPRKYRDLKNIMYEDFRIKYGVKKKFNACRG
jgi:hypothetical protein